MNKTVGMKPSEKAAGTTTFSMADQHSKGVPVGRPRIGGLGLDGTQDKSRI